MRTDHRFKPSIETLEARRLLSGAIVPPGFSVFQNNTTWLAEHEFYAGILSVTLPVQYSLLDAPAGMTITSPTNSDEPMLAWTPTESQVGSYKVTVVGSNSAGTMKVPFSIQVTPDVPDQQRFHGLLDALRRRAIRGRLHDRGILRPGRRRRGHQSGAELHRRRQRGELSIHHGKSGRFCRPNQCLQFAGPNGRGYQLDQPGEFDLQPGDHLGLWPSRFTRPQPAPDKTRRIPCCQRFGWRSRSRDSPWSADR